MRATERRHWLSKHLADFEEASRYCPPDFKSTPHYRFALAFRKHASKEEDLRVLLWAALFSDQSDPDASTMQRWKVLPSLFQDFESLLEDSELFAVLPSGTEKAFEPKPWKPAWFHEEGYFGKFVNDSLGFEKRRPEENISGDLVLSVLGYPNYRSKTQREAMRTILCAQPGSTITVNMPTGEGKSTLFFIPSLLKNEDGELGVTIIVVPTVALAEDLARRLKDYLSQPVCYSGESDEETKDAICAACRAGTQGALICNPEPLVRGRLSRAVRHAAANGFVKYFVIDEAHMVANWGDQFRPAFQSLEGFRKNLLESSPPESKFNTILTSATLTGYHMDLLEETFSEPDSFQIVHGARLRSEPSYWQINLDEARLCRDEIILQCAWHLPRPWILYGTKRQTVDDLYNLLQAQGFSRVGKIIGGSSERSSEQDKWNNDEIDIMVATSAFGLGVDKSNVRAVVHAELPESLDRFYQDVGRGGRDGRTCISLLLWKKEEWQYVERMGTPNQIGVELGYERWMKLFNSGSARGTEVSVKIDTPRTVAMNDSDQNRRWNLRVLNLMKRTGLLTFNYKEDELEKLERLWVKPATGHSVQSKWEEAVSAKRTSIKNHYRQAKDFMGRMLKPEAECISDVLKECYDVANRDLTVAKPCGGCRHCREIAREPLVTTLGTFPKLVPAKPRVRKFLDPEFGELTHGSNRLLVSCERTPDREILKASLASLARQGFCNFIGLGELSDLLPPCEEWFGSLVFSMEDFPFRNSALSSMPSVCWAASSRKALLKKSFEALQNDQYPAFVMFCWNDALVPDWGNRKIIDMVNCKKLRLEDHSWN